MHIILGIHIPHSHEPQLATYLERQLKADPNTYFIQFIADINREPVELSILRMGKTNPRLAGHLIEIKPANTPSFRVGLYEPYNQILRKTLEQLRKKLAIGEKVHSTGIGGQTREILEDKILDLCFTRINLKAQKAIRSIFRGRVKTQQTYLPFIWGNYGYQTKRYGPDGQRVTKSTSNRKKLRKKR
jgi:hypothetical protein